jgi:uncharacterized protein (DUF1778 family)
MSVQMSSAANRTKRIELRTHRVRAERIRYAARLEQKTVTGFMLDAATERAEDVISAATTTVAPSRFFDELWEALAAPSKPNAALARRARAKRRVTQK